MPAENRKLFAMSAKVRDEPLKKLILSVRTNCEALSVYSTPSLQILCYIFYIFESFIVNELYFCIPSLTVQ